MTSGWKNDGEGWKPADPVGFPDEATLHSLVGTEPQLLPLSGGPRLVIIGREVALGSGYADLIGIEPSGRPVVIEVKLARNSEARRAVVAQALAYAAYLHGLTADELERDVLGRHLQDLGFETLDAAVAANVQEGDFDTEAFRAALDEHLGTGSMRIVFVLDEAPRELVRLVGYLEAVAPGLTIDLIAASMYEIGGSKVLLPRREDPERRPEIPQPGARRPTQGATGTSFDGSEAFEEAIAEATAETQVHLRRMLDWARHLEAEGLVTLSSYRGVKGRWVLLPRLPVENVGLVTIWSENGAYLQLWQSVFERRAPDSIPAVESVTGLSPLGQGRVIHDPSDNALSALTDAHREAVRRIRQSAG